jgi:uncharacterized integral membrane protein
MPSLRLRTKKVPSADFQDTNGKTASIMLALLRRYEKIIRNNKTNKNKTEFNLIFVREKRVYRFCLETELRWRFETETETPLDIIRSRPHTDRAHPIWEVLFVCFVCFLLFIILSSHNTTVLPTVLITASRFLIFVLCCSVETFYSFTFNTLLGAGIQVSSCAISGQKQRMQQLLTKFSIDVDFCDQLEMKTPLHWAWYANITSGYCIYYFFNLFVLFLHFYIFIFILLNYLKVYLVLEHAWSTS